MNISEKRTEGRNENFNLDNVESIPVTMRKYTNRPPEGSTDKLVKRFKIISAIVLSAFGLTVLLFRTEANFLTINSMLAFAVWGWFTLDYKILQVDKLYLGSVGLGLAILFYGYFLNKEFSNEDNSPLLLVGTTMPIFFLTLQRPLRFAFKKIMKREPVVEKPSPSVADFVYTFILWMSTLLIPAFFFVNN